MNGVHKSGVRFLVVAVSALLGVLVFASAPALAAAPETPEALTPEAVSATAATLRGVLSPKATEANEGGTYQFAYRQGNACKGAGEKLAPESPGLSLGAPAETVQEPVSGLTANTEYTACLTMTNLKGETSPASPPVSFTTRIPPETPEKLEATEVTAKSATFKGVLNPKAEGEAGTFAFIYGVEPECEGSAGKETPSPPGATLGQKEEAVSASVTGLAPATRYHLCLRAQNQAGELTTAGPVYFTTDTAAPTVSGESSSSIGSSTVTLGARIDPNGIASRYHVEYVTDAQFKATGWTGAARAPESDAELPAANTPIPVSEALTGLQPSTTYDFRFVASNALGTGEGPGATFTTTTPASGGGPSASACPNSTFLGFGPSLPDCRAVELVSNAQQEGEVYVPYGPRAPGRISIEDPLTLRPFRAAQEGTTVAYVANPGAVGGNGAAQKGAGDEYLATRGPTAGPQGWESSNITPPVGEGETATNAEETAYEAFSADLSLGVLVTGNEPLVAPTEPQGPPRCAVLYSRKAGDGHLSALFSGTQTPGSCGEPAQPALGKTKGRLLFAGATPTGAQQLLFQSPAPLIEGATETEGEGANLYDTVAGAPRLVNVLPKGQVEPDATFGGPPVLRENAPDLSNVISPDGSRIVWSSVERLEEGRGMQPKALYVREHAAAGPQASTLQLDASQAPAGEGAREREERAERSGHGRLWAANTDGSKVYFTDCSRLTADSTAIAAEHCQPLNPRDEQPQPTGNDLYVYDFSRPPGDRLTDITVDSNGQDPRGADVAGVLGASSDGSYVYFVAGGALASEPNGNGETPTPRTCEESHEETQINEEHRGHLPAGKGCNLYVWHAGAATPLRFIAALAGKDDRFERAPTESSVFFGDWAPDLGSRTAQVSGDGRHVVFESTVHLTGYDTSALGSLGLGGERGREVFTYDAGTAGLACVSCDPGGAPPNASIEDSQTGGGVGTFLPSSAFPTFMPRWMSADGSRVFFDSSQPLVRQDTNGRQDVYEWEREGTPSCPAQTPARFDRGCVFLLSGGESSDYSYFIDADEAGDNVFITHRGQLSGAGPPDERVHLYDVRAGGGFARTALACEGSGCQGVPPAPPSFATPSSATFSGAGNYPPAAPPKRRTAEQLRLEHLAKALKACHAKHNKHKRRVCEAQARKRYPAPHKAKRAQKTAAKRGAR